MTTKKPPFWMKKIFKNIMHGRSRNLEGKNTSKLIPTLPICYWEKPEPLSPIPYPTLDPLYRLDLTLSIEEGLKQMGIIKVVKISGCRVVWLKVHNRMNLREKGTNCLCRRWIMRGSLSKICSWIDKISCKLIDPNK